MLYLQECRDISWRVSDCEELCAVTDGAFRKKFRQTTLFINWRDWTGTFELRVMSSVSYGRL